VSQTLARPLWSPDGKKLLLVSFANPATLYLLDMTTIERVKVCIPDHQVFQSPSWLDEGSLVAVVGTDKPNSVAVVDVLQPGQARIKQTLWQRGDGTNAEPVDPVYCPQRRQVVFVGRDKQGQALYTCEPGKTAQRLESEGLDRKIAGLALSPDGRYLLFCSDRASIGSPK
jgi:Tol biopolymer transport system component